MTRSTWQLDPDRFFDPDPVHDVNAQYDLARMYYMRGTNDDKAAAAEWLRCAAQGGHHEATEVLKEKASTRGGRDPEAAYQIALGYPVTKEYDVHRATVLFRACQKNHHKALTELKKAAEAGWPYAIKSLGNCYARGIMVEKDLEKAITLLETAAKKDVPGAQRDLNLAKSEI